MLGHVWLTRKFLVINFSRFLSQGSIMKMQHSLLFAALACAGITGLASFGSSAHAYNLQQAYNDALAIDLLVASNSAAVRAAKEKIAQAESLSMPQINATTAINRQVTDPSNIPTRNFTSQNYGMNLSYPLYRAQNIETLEQAKLGVAITETQLANAQQDLILRVTQAYFDVLASQDTLEVIRAQKKAIAEQLQSAKRNFEVGTATITDQQEAQARDDLVTFQEIAGLNDLETKRAALSTLTGQPVRVRLDGLKTGVTLAPPQPSNIADWTDAARRNNYSVQQLQIASENAKREVTKQRLATRPTVDLVGSVSHVENIVIASVGTRANNAALGVQLNMPIYTGGAIESRIREAAANLNKAEIDLANARNQAALGTQQAYLGLNSLINQVAALQAAERSSRLALDSNLLGYQVGVRINIDVLNAQQQVFSTQRDLAKTRYDVLVNGLRLKATTASLLPTDITNINALLEPIKPVSANLPPPINQATPATPATSGSATPQPPKSGSAATQPVPQKGALSPGDPAPIKQTRGGRTLPSKKQ